MGNLYRLNSLFELEISQYPEALNLDKGLLERSSAFEYLFLLISSLNDRTILSEPISEELVEHWEKNKISHGKPIKTDNPYFATELSLEKKLTAETNLVEWGRTSILNKKAFYLEKKNQTIFHSRSINSKVNQARWKESIKMNTINSVVCVDKFELEYALSCMEAPFVIKSEFSFAGRGNLVLKSKADVKEFGKKIDAILKENPNGIVLEEWVEESKIQDFSGLFELSKKKSILVAITKMLIDKNGIYRGSLIQKNFGEELRPGMQEVANNTQRYNSSYSGPISIDGFVFKKENKVEIQYMSEINFRYSMGRILFELGNKIGVKNEEYALLFFTVKAKSLKFKSLISDINKLEKEFKSLILIVTPLTKSNGTVYPFLGFYVSSKEKFPTKISDSIKKLLN